MLSPEDHTLSPEERIAKRLSQRANLPGGTETILVIDDEPLVQKVNACELEKLGYRVVCARNGEEGVMFLREHRADLVLLDLMMPGMDGVETFRRIKEFNPEQKAVVYSGYAQPSQVTAIQELGAKPVLLKPTPILELATAIRTRLDASTPDTGTPTQ